MIINIKNSLKILPLFFCAISLFAAERSQLDHVGSRWGFDANAVIEIWDAIGNDILNLLAYTPKQIENLKGRGITDHYRLLTYLETLKEKQTKEGRLLTFDEQIEWFWPPTPPAVPAVPDINLVGASSGTPTSSAGGNDDTSKLSPRSALAMRRQHSPAASSIAPFTLQSDPASDFWTMAADDLGEPLKKYRSAHPLFDKNSFILSLNRELGETVTDYDLYQIFKRANDYESLYGNPAEQAAQKFKEWRRDERLKLAAPQVTAPTDGGISGSSGVHNGDVESERVPAGEQDPLTHEVDRAGETGDLKSSLSDNELVAHFKRCAWRYGIGIAAVALSAAAAAGIYWYVDKKKKEQSKTATVN